MAKPETRGDADAHSVAGDGDDDTENLDSSILQPLQHRNSVAQKVSKQLEKEKVKKGSKSNGAASGHNILSGFSLPGGSCLGPTSDMDLGAVGVFFRRGALLGFALWLLLLFITFRFAPTSSYEVPGGYEQNAHVISFALILVTNGSVIFPLILRENSFEFIKSGVLVGTLAVQMIALASNLLLSFVPTPVLYDEISGLRFHLVRWAEWIPLTFLMTFLTNNIDAPLRGSKVTYRTPIIMAVSSSAGMLFPFCKTFSIWMANMAISWVLFLSIYVLLYERAQRYFAVKGLSSSRESSQQQERLDLVRSSYVICAACSTTWTLLAAIFTCLSLGSSYAPKDSIFASPRLPEIILSIFEVASKIWYLSALIDAYDRVFDEKSRAVRRLEELRSFMSAVWESSSDVIVFCLQDKDRVSARISPAFLKMVGLTTGRLPYLNRGDISLVLEIFPDKGLFNVFAMDLSKPVTRDDASRFRETLTSHTQKLDSDDRLSSEEKNILIMAKLAVKAARASPESGSETSLMQDFVICDKDGNESKLGCEAKIAKLEGQSSVLVLRDISDRMHRFETEKKLLAEVTIRKKDAEANQFTRHEVKNGILAAIALLDHIREMTEKSTSMPDTPEEGSAALSSSEPQPTGLAAQSSKRTRSVDDLASHSAALGDSLDELDSTLHDILDTILDEAMGREIIYGEYEPRKERTNVPEILASLRRRTSSRFPLNVTTEPFPSLELDKQLLRYIYRNAVSNACRYGQVDGIVETVVHYNAEKRLLYMEVINLPGEGHEELTKLDAETVTSIFSPNTRLLSPEHAVAGSKSNRNRSESSGHGAWIMQKCADSLGGKCDIQFEPERTVFTFCCPAKAYFTDADVGSDSSEDEFCLPDTCWGIVVDDSAIQRKLMDRFLKLAGIHSSRRLILGKDSEEVFGFCGNILSLMEENPNDKFLLIADENLDIVDGGTLHQTVSGSFCVQELRAQLDDSTEARLLALIRSANDSSAELELYRSRAHGYLLKEPMRKGRILDLIKPWCIARFPSNDRGEQVAHYPASDDDSYTYGPSADDIRAVLSVIQALCSVSNDGILDKRWRPIREKLHKLKGDLKTTTTEESLAQILECLDRLIACPELPTEFLQEWADVKAQIEAAL